MSDVNLAIKKLREYFAFSNLKSTAEVLTTEEAINVLIAEVQKLKTEQTFSVRRPVALTIENYLLTKLAEECIEVAQRCTKAMTFGINEIQEGQSLTNAERIMDELVDVRVILMMLQERGVLPMADTSQDTMDRKRSKVLKFMAYSQDQGTLEKGRL